MRVLNSTEIQDISGGWVIAAVLSVTPAALVGLGATVPSVLGAPLVYMKGKTRWEGFKNAAYQTTLGAQMSWDIIKSAYYW